MPVSGGLTFKRINAVAVTAGTPQTIWTPAAGMRFRVMGFSLGVTVAAASVFLVEGAGNVATGLATPILAINGVCTSPRLGNGYQSVAADNALKIDVSATSTVSGSVFGVEE